MALELELLSSGGLQLPNIDKGTHQGCIVDVIDLGKQALTEVVNGANQPKVKNGVQLFGARVLIGVELVNEQFVMEATEDKPEKTIFRKLYREYSLSKADSANLMKLLKELKPTAKSVAELAGLPCMVGVGETSGGRNKITSLIPLMKGMTPKEPGNPIITFDFDKPVAEVVANLPEWITNNLKEAQNYAGSEVQKMLEEAASSGDAEADSAAEGMLG